MNGAGPSGPPRSFDADGTGETPVPQSSVARTGGTPVPQKCREFTSSSSSTSSAQAPLVSRRRRRENRTPAPQRRRFGMRKTLTYFLLILGGAVMLFPLWWMFVTSLSSAEQAAASASFAAFRWPERPQWENYPAALQKFGSGSADALASDAAAVDTAEGAAAAAAGSTAGPTRRSSALSRYRGFLDALANTIVVTTLSVIGQVLSCSLVGYGFARLRFRGREPLFLVMLSTMMLPAQVTMIPLFILFRALGWIDTFLPLVVPLFFGTPFFIFMFRQFFAQVPEALVEAARIDGCGHLAI